MYVILVYDISLKDRTTGQKVLRNVFKTCKRYLNHIQNSVFEGSLTEATFAKLKYELSEIIDEETDSVIFFTSSSQEWLDKEVIGNNKNECSNLL